MFIDEVKTAFKIADVEYIQNSTKLNFKYLTNIIDEQGNSLPQDILTRNYSRVYLIVVDGIIKKIEFYMIYHDDFDYEVKGLFKKHKVQNVGINCKLIEECCIRDYLSKEHKYPEWNVQEQGMDWPEEIKIKHSDITQNSLNSSSSRGKIIM